MDAPSPNGSNGRDENGRFAKGNRGGPGNPHARRVAALRIALLDAVDGEAMRDVVDGLVQRARGGDMAAIKLIFQYTVGKPVAAVDPDSLELHEMKLAWDTQDARDQKLLADALTSIMG